MLEICLIRELSLLILLIIIVKSKYIWCRVELFLNLYLVIVICYIKWYFYGCIYYFDWSSGDEIK